MFCKLSMWDFRKCVLQDFILLLGFFFNVRPFILGQVFTTIILIIFFIRNKINKTEISKLFEILWDFQQNSVIHHVKMDSYLASVVCNNFFFTRVTWLFCLYLPKINYIALLFTFNCVL